MIPCTIKNNKILGINLKEVKKFVHFPFRGGEESLREIKDVLNKWRVIPC
jgi:hypothetical protein